MMVGSPLLIGLGALEQRLDLLLLRSNIQSANTFSTDLIDSIAGVVTGYFESCRRKNMIDTSEMRNGRGVGIRIIQGETFDAETSPELKGYNVCFVSKSKPKSEEYSDYIGCNVNIPAVPGRFTFFNMRGGRFNSLTFNDYDSLMNALEKLFPRLMLTDFKAYRADEESKKNALEQEHRAMLERKIREADDLHFDMNTKYSQRSSFGTFFKWFHLRYYEKLEVPDLSPLCFITENSSDGDKSFVLKYELKVIKVTSIIGNLVESRKCYVQTSTESTSTGMTHSEFSDASELTSILLAGLEWIKKKK